MDHTEARVLLMDLALAPARVRMLVEDSASMPPALRAHIQTCGDCKTELESWRLTVAALDMAVSAGSADADDPARSIRELAASAGAATMPPGLRERTLTAASDSTSPQPILPDSGVRRARRLPVWLAAAAALVLLVGGGAFAVDRTFQLNQANSEISALASATTDLDRILADPGHKVAQLATLDGKPAGSVSWSTAQDQVVVLTSALQPPPAGQVYRCRVMNNGSATVVGEMRFSGSVAYWAGSLSSWGASFAPGSQFTVSLEPSDWSSGGTRVLVGTL